MTRSGRRLGVRPAGVSATLALTALLAAGCGSAAKPVTVPSSARSPATSAAYASAVKAECQSIAGDSALKKQAGEIEKSGASESATFAKILALTTSEYVQFDSITPPAGDAAAASFHRDLTALIAASGAFQHDVKDTTTGAPLTTAEHAVVSSINRVGADFKALNVGNCGTA